MSTNTGVNVLNSDLRGSVKKDVSFIEGAWVEFFDDVTIGAVTAAEKAEKENDVDSVLTLLLTQIKDWNFAGPDGEILPINKDSLGLLSVKLLKWMAEAQKEILSTLSITEEKKSESPSS